MRRRLRFFATASVSLTLVANLLLFSPMLRGTSAQIGGVQRPVGSQPGKPQPGAVQLSAAAQEQIRTILAEKRSRTRAQSKIGSSLLYAAKERRGESMTSRGTVLSMRSGAAMARRVGKGRADVDIKGTINKQLIESIEKFGGEVKYASAKAGAVRASVPFDALEPLAELPAVRSINQAATAVTHRQLERTRAPGIVSTAPAFQTRSSLPTGLRPNFDRRADKVRTWLSSSLAHERFRSLAQEQARLRGVTQDNGAQTNSGAATSAGDMAHGATDARNFFGVNGAGVKIGVLSDSVDFLAESIASGDLPPDVTVLPGQSGVPGVGEGTAMLQIIHDVAPGAKLYFATAFNGIDSFADNIRALRAAGCDIIVDDVIYFVESPFHDDVVSAAVEQVTADGALYFSSAGNEGNFNDGTSGTWEGDFRDSGFTLASLPGGTLHDFGRGVISNLVEVSSLDVLTLHWSDPLGASSNDYDLFIMDNTLTTVLDASTTVQDGDDDPIEITSGAFAGERVLIYKADGAEIRALHLNNFRGELGIATPGTIRGHAAAPGAFAVAAIDAAIAGGGLFTGGPTSPVEIFSADGNRRVFYKSDGTPFTPGSLLFLGGGGELRRKPDLTAADGVATTVPGFESFFGTSAAAPHAAAIAALLKSAKPTLTPARIRRALTSTALDIEASGNDRDAGAGILDAFAALFSIGAAPRPVLESGTVATTPTGGDGDPFVEPGESGTITVPLTNIGGATALSVGATLTTTTPGVTITSGTSSYPNIGSNGQNANNLTPFTFTVDPTAACGVAIDFTLTVTYSNSATGPQALTFRVQTGEPGTAATTFSYTGPVAPIPDNTPGGVNVPITVSGLPGSISDIDLRFDGSSCTNTEGATTVGLDHTWVGDLVITLTSPQGTTVTLMSSPGGATNNGNNFCNTVLDDAATSLIQGIPIAGAPWTGSFIPANPLAAFNGENGNGVWTLNVTDSAGADTGSVRAFSLVFTASSCTAP